MPDIVISEFIDQRALDRLCTEFDVLFDPELYKCADDLNEACSKARALIVRNQTQLDKKLIDVCSRLQAVGRLGVGLDNIDVEACRQGNIRVIPATGANAASVAEYVITGMLMLFRGAYTSTDKVLSGEWPRSQLIGREANGKTLGLIGLGATGRAVAKRALGLDMKVIACDPALPSGNPIWNKLGVSSVEKETLLRDADVASLHVPLLPATRRLIDTHALEMMKPSAILINASRGGLVDETALVQALNGGKLSGAMLDVFEHEPLPANSHLVEVPNLILTPHIAGVTQEANHRVSMMIADKVTEVLKANV